MWVGVSEGSGATVLAGAVCVVTGGLLFETGTAGGLPCTTGSVDDDLSFAFAGFAVEAGFAVIDSASPAAVSAFRCALCAAIRNIASLVLSPQPAKNKDSANANTLTYSNSIRLHADLFVGSIVFTIF